MTFEGCLVQLFAYLVINDVNPNWHC